MSALSHLLRLVPLEHLPRTGWAQRGIARPESVAAHITGTCAVALALGPRVEPAIDTDRAVALALVHDIPEAWVSDLPRSASELLPEGAKQTAEDGAARRLLGDLNELALARFHEFRAGETREARFAKICDKLQLGIRLVAYEQAGARGLEEFHEVVRELDCGEFVPAQELRAEILAALRE